MPISPRVQPPAATAQPPLANEGQLQIDADLTRLEEQATALRTRRNALASSSRLPPEILSRIFSFIMSGINANTSVRRLVAFTYVCRYWRDVALSFPALWSNLVFANPNWAREMLTRSKKARLVIVEDCGVLPTSSLDILKDALNQLERVEEVDLVLDVGSASHKGLLEQLTSQPAPVLHTLSIIGSLGSAYTRLQMHGIESETTLSADLLQGNAPQLRKLEIIQFFLPWTSPLYGNLRSLILEDSEPLKHSMSDILDALEKMPQLEELSLDRALPKLGVDMGSMPRPSRTVDLPRLNKLRVLDGTAMVVHLLDHLGAIAAGCVTNFVCQNNEANTNDFSRFLSAIQRFIRSDDSEGQSSSVYDALDFKIVNSSTLTFQAWRDVGVELKHPALSLPTSKPDIALGLHWAMGPYDKVLNNVCGAVPLRDARYLWVTQASSPVVPKTWKNNFVTLPHVECISLRGGSPGPLLKALTPVVRAAKKAKKGGRKKKSGPAEPQSLELCPALRSLAFQGVNFLYRNQNFHGDLKNLLFVRSGFEGASIETLHFDSCLGVYKREMDFLKDIVSELSHSRRGTYDESDEEFDIDDVYSDSDSMYDDLLFPGPLFLPPWFLAGAGLPLPAPDDDDDDD